MSSKLSTILKVFDWCLRGLGLFVIYALINGIISIGMQWRFYPPNEVKDIGSFREWRPEFTGARKIAVRGSVYYAVQGPFARTMPSAKSEYYFDSNGNYLDWNVDPGDDKTPSLFFSSDAEYTGISIDEIPKPSVNKPASPSTAPATSRSMVPPPPLEASMSRR